MRRVLCFAVILIHLAGCAVAPRIGYGQATPATVSEQREWSTWQWVALIAAGVVVIGLATASSSGSFYGGPYKSAR